MLRRTFIQALSTIPLIGLVVPKSNIVPNKNDLMSILLIPISNISVQCVNNVVINMNYSVWGAGVNVFKKLTRTTVYNLIYNILGSTKPNDYIGIVYSFETNDYYATYGTHTELFTKFKTTLICPILNKDIYLNPSKYDDPEFVKTQLNRYSKSGIK
jgi:hypothetical protein